MFTVFFGGSGDKYIGVISHEGLDKWLAQCREVGNNLDEDVVTNDEKNKQDLPNNGDVNLAIEEAIEVLLFLGK